jgi:hypothetical protein
MLISELECGLRSCLYEPVAVHVSIARSCSPVLAFPPCPRHIPCLRARGQTTCRALVQVRLVLIEKAGPVLVSLVVLI